MAVKHPLIVFDWDGTILDSAGAIVRAIQAACADLELPPPSDARARHVIGLGLVDAMRHAVPELDQGRYAAMVERYRFHYLSGDHQLILFSGIHELLCDLRDRGHLLAIATGKSRAGLERALDHSGLRPFFLASRCADECRSKPDPQMLEELLSEFGLGPSAALMIGDTSHDLLMARNAGVGGVAVTYGAHQHDHLREHGPLICVHTVRELSSWLSAHG